MTPLAATDVVRILRADPDAYTEAYLICGGALWHRADIAGLVKVDDMLIVNAGPSVPSPAVLAGLGRAAREHGIGMHPPATVTARLLTAALDAVDWDEVGSKMLAATLAQLDYQTRHQETPAPARAARQGDDPDDHRQGQGPRAAARLAGRH
jgi:hypothetical protein